MMEFNDQYRTKRKIATYFFGSMVPLALGALICFSLYSCYKSNKPSENNDTNKVENVQYPVQPQTTVQIPHTNTNKVSNLEKSLEFPGVAPEANPDDVWSNIIRKK